MANTTMKDLLAGAGFSTSDELNGFEEGPKHASDSRRKNVLERPDKEVELLSLAEECREIVKTQKDPTDDLVFFPRVWAKGATIDIPEATTGYLIQDKDTKEVFYAHDKKCLDANFIYRDDLVIREVGSTGCWPIFKEMMEGVNTGCIPNRTKYILDDPGSETYEVYAESTYPSLKYGKATPTGMTVHSYQNRFHRDMAILELDQLYSNSSHKQAGKLTAKKLAANEAIIISDGAWMKETCSSCYFYLDNTTVLKQVEGVVPSEPDQAVLIAEINGAYNALMQCYLRGKTSIKYYYDNTSILNVFKNRKTEYVEEVKRYKDFLNKMDREGFTVTFIELHPKTDEEKDKLNKALTYFHNSCDAECRVMAEIFKKNYKDFVVINESDGTDFSKFQKQNKPKGNNNNKPYGKPRRVY